MKHTVTLKRETNVTRINTIDPKHLTDQHLMAEYRELPMVLSALKRSLQTQSESTIIKKIPGKFTLNSGHVLFFYDKILFLKRRYEQLQLELIDRGFNIDLDRKLKVAGFPNRFYSDWYPNAEAQDIIKERITGKIQAKQGWYKYNSKPLTREFLDYYLAF